MRGRRGAEQLRGHRAREDQGRGELRAGARERRATSRVDSHFELPCLVAWPLPDQATKPAARRRSSPCSSRPCVRRRHLTCTWPARPAARSLEAPGVP
eukprot:13241323-Alexandrium_andersonii.AAC.1